MACRPPHNPRPAPAPPPGPPPPPPRAREPTSHWAPPGQPRPRAPRHACAATAAQRLTEPGLGRTSPAEPADAAPRPHPDPRPNVRHQRRAQRISLSVCESFRPNPGSLWRAGGGGAGPGERRGGGDDLDGDAGLRALAGAALAVQSPLGRRHEPLPVLPRPAPSRQPPRSLRAALRAPARRRRGGPRLAGRNRSPRAGRNRSPRAGRNRSPRAGRETGPTSARRPHTLPRDQEMFVAACHKTPRGAL